MQKILVPTDFSAVADNALEHAIEIAALFQSEILLYHVYNFQRSVHYNSNFPEHEQPFVKDIEAAMEATRLKFMDKIEEKGIKLKTRVKEDTVFALFGSEAEEHNIDFIVMGSKGASGVSKVIFGSFAATAMDIADVPVLVVPPDHKALSITKMLWASDQEDVSSQTIEPFRLFASKTQSKVTVLSVTKSQTGNKPTSNLRLEGVDTSYEQIPASGSVNDTINHYVDSRPFDLIAMVRRDRGFFESLFKKSITKEQVFNSKIPLLILPEKD